MKIDMDELRFFERVSKEIYYTLYLQYKIECKKPDFSFEGYPNCEILFDDIIIGNSVIRIVMNTERNLLVVSATYKSNRFFFKESKPTIALYGAETGKKLATEIFTEFEKIKQKDELVDKKMNSSFVSGKSENVFVPVWGPFPWVPESERCTMRTTGSACLDKFNS